MSDKILAKEESPLPFGTKFGQKFNPSKHEYIRRIENVRSVNLRTSIRPEDTEILRGKICDSYGLQVVTWRSHIRSLNSANKNQKEIIERFTKMYGKPTTNYGSWFWQAHNSDIIVKIRSNSRLHQNQIRLLGPKNIACIEHMLRKQNNNKHLR